MAIKMRMRAGFADLYTACMWQQDIEMLEAFPDNLLGEMEFECKHDTLYHVRHYGKLPSFRYASRDEVMRLHINKDTIYRDESPEYVYDLVLKYKQMATIREAYTFAKAEYDEGGDFNIVRVERAINNSRKAGREEVVNLFNINRDDMYELATYGGALEFGLEFIDKAVGGIHAAESVLLAARTGVGKSWVACHSAVKWAREGHQVLVISLEMSPVQLAHRIDAILGGFNPKVFRKQIVSQDTMNRYKRLVRKEMKAIYNNGGNIIFNKSNDLSLHGLEVTIEKTDCTVLICDGAYLVTDSASKASWESARNVSGMLKRTSMNRDIPVFSTVQLKRTGKEDGFTTEDIAYSDAFGQDADAVIVLSPEGPTNLLAEVIKNRHGESYGASVLRMDHSISTMQEVEYRAPKIELGGES